MLKSRIFGQNPCNIDKLFRRIKQFGSHSLQGGDVSAVEMELWDYFESTPQWNTDRTNDRQWSG